MAILTDYINSQLVFAARQKLASFREFSQNDTISANFRLDVNRWTWHDPLPHCDYLFQITTHRHT